jgi:hypothetical protein
MKKIKLWFIYEGVVKGEEFSSLTKKVIKLIKELEKNYAKEMFDLRSIEYARFLSESKKDFRIKRSDLPTVIINAKIVFTKKLPDINKLKKEIKWLLQNE